MLQCTPTNLFNEVREDISYWRKVTDVATPIIQQYAQNSRTDWTVTGDVGENYPYQHVCNWVPTLVDDGAILELESAVPGEQNQTVDAMRTYMRQWIQDVDIINDNWKYLAHDVQFGPAIGVMKMEPLPGYENVPGGPTRPAPFRLDPRRYFEDRMALDPDSYRYCGHIASRDRDDMLNAKNADGSPVFNAEVVTAMPTDVGLDEIYDPKLRRKESAGGNTTRNQIVYYEIFVPETMMIYTLGYVPADGGNSVEGAWLREPRQYFGPPWGPYTRFWIHYIPGQLHTLAPLSATASLAKEISTHVGQAQADAMSAKRLMFVDSTRQDIMKAITSGKNNNVYGIPGFNPAMAQMYDVSGPSPDRLSWIQWRREYLDQLSGLTQTQRGQVNASVTATAESIASEAASGRMKHAKTMFKKGCEQMLYTAAWMAFNSETVRQPVTFRDDQTGAKIPLEFRGGIQEGQQPQDFNSLNIKITSLGHESDASRRQTAMQVTEMCLQMVPMLLQYPYLNGREIMDYVLTPFGISDGGSRLINFKMLEQLQMMQTLQAVGAFPGMDAGGAGGEGGPNVNGSAKKISGSSTKSDAARSKSSTQQARRQTHKSTGD